MQNPVPLAPPLEFAWPPRIEREQVLHRAFEWVLSPAAMVLVALALRIAVIVWTRAYLISPSTDHFAFGWETGRIARALAEGQGFSSPFQGRTGPTAWVAPLYPALAAGVFRMFGVYTVRSAWVLLTINSLFSALTCWPLYLIAKEVAGIRVARGSGWAWALLPHAMYWSSRWIWETSLTALLLTVTLLLTLRLDRRATMRTWLWLGLTWGVIALTNPSCLSLLPICGIWVAYRLYRQRRPWFAGAAASALVFLALFVPWTIRNYEVFHRFVPVRDNFGVEFWLGNSDWSQGLWMMWMHPSTNDIETAKYARMGELAYIHSKRDEAMQFVREHPARFAELCVRRIGWWWVGLPKPSEKPFVAETRNSSVVLGSLLAWWGMWMLVRDRRRAARLLASFLIVFPAVYYLTFVDPRYRHPIEPVMTIAAIYLLSRVQWRRRHAQKPIEIPREVPRAA